MTIPLRWRIAISYVILILLTMLGLSIYLVGFIENSFVASLERSLQVQTLAVADVITPLLEQGVDPSSAQLDSIAKHWATVLGARVTIIRPDGVVLGESHEDRAQMSNHGDRPEVKDALATGNGRSIRFSNTVGYDMLYVATRLGDSSAPLGISRVALPLNQVQADIRNLQMLLLSATTVATLAAIILATWLGWRIARPVVQITNAAMHLAAGQPFEQHVSTSIREMAQLAQAFNNMLMRTHTQIDELQTERSKLSAVLEKMTDGVLIVNEEGEIQLINASAERIFNLTQTTALGKPLAKAIRHHQPFELWQQCQHENSPQQATFDLHKNRCLQGVATSLGQSLPGSTLLLFQDVTRQRQIENMRRDFISNVSHELRTPLASIKAITETLQSGALEDPPAARRFLGRMDTEVDALSLMVNELLELSRIESGRVPLQLKPTRPIDIIQPAYERLCIQAERARLTIEMDCPETLPPVLADASRIQQVAVNLLHNAIKFTGEGGQVTIGAQIQGQEMVFFVRDTGVGISGEDLPRIFERFYKADRARSSSGTGLGLAIARHLIEAHQGRIWAESELNQGSTFYYTLPLA
jgi:two-component system phosphate regulon sensor histidine kinase PhoR